MIMYHNYYCGRAIIYTLDQGALALKVSTSSGIAAKYARDREYNIIMARAAQPTKGQTKMIVPCNYVLKMAADFFGIFRPHSMQFHTGRSSLLQNCLLEI